MPSEEKRLQVRASDEIAKAKAAFESVWNIVATLDSSNQSAIADIVVDDVPLVSKVPITTLLFLEKQLVDVCTLVNALPVLDPAEEWTYDNAIAAFRSTVVETVRTQKVLKAFVKYEATKEHPAQVDTYTEDVPVGTWKNTKLSGAIEQKEKEEMLERARKLLAAIKQAREAANSMTAISFEPAKPLLDYVFGK